MKTNRPSKSHHTFRVYRENAAGERWFFAQEFSTRGRAKRFCRKQWKSGNRNLVIANPDGLDETYEDMDDVQPSSGDTSEAGV